MNSKFLGRLYCILPAVACFFMLYNEAFLLLIKNVTHTGQKKLTLWSLMHTTKHTVTWCIYVLRLASY